jgi:hypothetical protein
VLPPRSSSVCCCSFTWPEPLHQAPSAKRSGWLEGPHHRRTKGMGQVRHLSESTR